MITFLESKQKIVDTLETVNHSHWIGNYNGTISCCYCHPWFYTDGRYSYTALDKAIKALDKEATNLTDMIFKQ